MDNIDIIFDELKQNEIDKQTLSFHIYTMINQHRDIYREMNTRDLNLEQVYREINVTNFGCIIAYLAFVCLQNDNEESIGDHVQPIKNGNVSIECRFGTPLETAINIVVLGEFQSLIEIDANRNMLRDFNN